MQPYAHRAAAPAAPLIERDGNWYRLEGEGTAIEDTVPEPGDFIRGGRVWRMPPTRTPARLTSARKGTSWRSSRIAEQ
jgi:hypothetical protein